MTIGSDKDLKSLEKIGQIVSLAREEMIKAVRVGITTKELDRTGELVLLSYGAKSAPKAEYNFPGYTCISVNDEAAHGIPGSRVLEAGDIVNIDVSAELDGYFADTGATVSVSENNRIGKRLCDCSRSALAKGIDNARAGAAINQIGRAIHQEAKENGYTVIRNLTGHGIGRKLHEEPSHVLNYYNKWDRRILNIGLVLAIETFLSQKAEFVIEDKNGWTLRTSDRSRVAQFEHTVIVTEKEPIIITA
ncbi:MAG TPA: type I methionyl aminopeptidase [Anaerovoracaceae bacterium]|nr:type I methionyl aminopeptidase [Anaerovoracaceae bacterium]